MIHTIQYCSIVYPTDFYETILPRFTPISFKNVDAASIEIEKNIENIILENETIKPTKFNRNSIKKYIYETEYLKFEYYPQFNCLMTIANPSKLLNKDNISDIDYSPFMKAYCGEFYKLFKYTKADYTLSRIDYKIDILTPDKQTYIDLFKKSYEEYKHLKQNDKYDTSIYYNGKTATLNLYDKQEERESKIQIVDEKYLNMLRVEVQFKRNFFRYMKREYGIVDELQNYFTELDRDFYLNKYLKPIIFTGDYYSIYHARKRLNDYYPNKKIMVNKLEELLKLISKNGVSGASEKYKYSHSTFNQHLKLLMEAGVNPILIPKNRSITHLPNLFNFTNENIYLIESWRGLKAA